MYLYCTTISVPIRIMADGLYLKHELPDDFSNKVLQKCLTTTLTLLREFVEKIVSQESEALDGKRWGSSADRK